MDENSNSRASWIRRGIGHIKKLDRWFVVLLALILVLLFGFINLAEEVYEGDTRSFDEYVLLLFNSSGDSSNPTGPVWLPGLIRDFTALGSTGVLAIVVFGVTVYLVLSGKRKTALYILIAVISGVVLEHFLKIGFGRPRPDLVPHGVVVTSLSFPSGHSLNSAVVYITLGNLLAQTQKKLSLKIFLMSFSVFLAILIGVSRIYLGVHWPTDVIAGWAVGASWALICWAVMLHLQQRGKVEPETSTSVSPDG
jgi:undecaprenyl-diphosphatase